MIDKTESEIMRGWKGDSNKPLVSICTITYNHEKYIAEALNSFLMQETDFPIEIIVDDDSSTDSTAAILEEYKNKYPIIITINIRSTNIGMMENFVSNIEKAKGKYIALCEGDDYWTNSLKLDRQVGFLENHQEYSASAHQSMAIYEAKANIKNHLFKKNIQEYINLEDIIHYHNFQTATFVFRSEFIHKYHLPINLLSGDKALFFLCASLGPIKYFSECMSVYRKHDGGVSSWVRPELLIKDLNIVPWISKINPKFPKYRFKAYVYESLMRIPKQENLFLLYKNYLFYVYYSFSFFPKNLKKNFAFLRLVASKTIKYFFLKWKKND